MSESVAPLSPDSEPDRYVPDSVIPHQTLPPLRYRDLPDAPHWTKMVGPSIILAGLALGSGEFILWPYITYQSGFVFFWACLLGVITQFFVNMEIERWTLATGESAIVGFCRLSRHWAWVFLLMNIIPWMWPGWSTGAAQIVSWMTFGPQHTVEVPLTQPEFRQWIGDPENTDPGPPIHFDDELAKHVRLERQNRELVWSGSLSDQDRADLMAAGTAEKNYQEAAARIIRQIEAAGKDNYAAVHFNLIAIGTLVLVGLVLTSGPVVYNTVEQIQFVLVGMIFLIVVVLAVLVVRWDAIVGMARGAVDFGFVPDLPGLDQMTLLGALAFAGAGGTMNLGQSNFIKDKGYAMGRYLGRITSPITGNEETTSETGFHFEHNSENMLRWRHWWKAANLEHFFSFFLTCVACLVLLSLITYSLLYDSMGVHKAGMGRLGSGMNFVWGQAMILRQEFGGLGTLIQYLYLTMGVAILMTTELGILDATARISTDIVKVNYLRDNPAWSQSRLYFFFLWGEIAIGAFILLIGFKEPLTLLKTSAAMNGGVMFLYSAILLYMNMKILGRDLSPTPLRFAMLIWACAFFGYFTIHAMKDMAGFLWARS